MDLAAVGSKIQAKRIEAGLLQEHVAKLSGLSRVTINQLENGTLKDLGYAKLNAVLGVLGMGIDVPISAGLQGALSVAARSVSTSYRDLLSAEMLGEMLRSGRAPDRYHPHLMAFLDETPLPLAVQAISEAATPQIPTRQIMKHLGQWSKEWRTCRTVWF